MAPKKGTKAYKEEYVSTIYGIDGAGRVRSVAVRRDGLMIGTAMDGTPVRRSRAGSSPEHEAIVAFGLTDVFTVPEVMRENVSYVQKVKDLEEKAGRLRADHEPQEE